MEYNNNLAAGQARSDDVGSSEGWLREAMGDGVEFKGGSFWREIEGMAHHMAIARVVHEIIG